PYTGLPMRPGLPSTHCAGTAAPSTPAAEASSHAHSCDERPRRWRRCLVRGLVTWPHGFCSRTGTRVVSSSLISRAAHHELLDALGGAGVVGVRIGVAHTPIHWLDVQRIENRIALRIDRGRPLPFQLHPVRVAREGRRPSHGLDTAW